MINLFQHIKLLDLGVIIDDALVISDIHIGYEEALNKEGILIPRFQFRLMIERLEKIFSEIRKNKLKISRIILNGDLKHEFGKISDSEWRHTLRLLDLLSKNFEKVILVRGNHDTILGPIAEKRNIEIVDKFVIGDNLILHGDDLITPSNGIHNIIIGHEHAAISLRDGARVEKFKCFLFGKWKKYNLLVMPSFFQVTEGTDVLREQLLSPYLQDGIANFRVFIVEQEVLDFGFIKDLTINDANNR